MGGSMMGIAQPSLDVPVIKTTNCIIACSDMSTVLPKQTACIKCSRCLHVCPMSLMPLNFETAYATRNTAMLRHFKVNMCTECGSCAYVCPAKRHLVQAVQLSKELLWLEKQKEAK
jgi:electron transport complex protein RnfC